MAVYCGDTRNFLAPPGWHFLVEEPAYVPEADCELWSLEYTGE